MTSFGNLRYVQRPKHDQHPALSDTLSKQMWDFVSLYSNSMSGTVSGIFMFTFLEKCM